MKTQIFIALLLFGTATNGQDITRKGKKATPAQVHKLETEAQNGWSEGGAIPTPSILLETFARWWYIDIYGDTMIAGYLEGARTLVDVAEKRDMYQRKTNEQAEEIRQLRNQIEVLQMQLNVYKAAMPKQDAGVK